MKGFHVSRPSPALVVSFLALLVALSGVAVALPGRNSVDRGDIEKNAVTTKKIKKAAVKASRLANGAVRTTKIAGGAVAGPKLANDAVAAAKIVDGSVTAAEIGAAAVGSSEIGDGLVAESDLADGSVTTAKIAGSAVTSGAIAGDAVTSAKIAGGAVGSGEIGDGQVAPADLARPPRMFEYSQPADTTDVPILTAGDLLLRADCFLGGSGHVLRIEAASSSGSGTIESSGIAEIETGVESVQVNGPIPVDTSFVEVVSIADGDSGPQGTDGNFTVLYDGPGLFVSVDMTLVVIESGTSGSCAAGGIAISAG
jgi:hypothetical protein